MSVRRTIALTCGALALAVGGVVVAHGVASAADNAVVVQRFLLGYFDKRGRFVPTAGRASTNIARNAIGMFVFSGVVDAGPNLRGSLALTLEEQAELQARIESDPDYDPTQDGYEPGAIPRRRTADRAAYYVATGSINDVNVFIGAQTPNGFDKARGHYFKVLKPGAATRIVPNRVIFNPGYVPSTYDRPGEIDYNPVGLEANTTYTVFLDGGDNANPTNTVKTPDGKLLAEPFLTSFTTGTRYIQDYSRPEVRETSPSDLSVNVAYDADIDITFNEPMDVASFVLPKFQGDDQYTILVKYDDNVAINGSLAGRNVLGVMRVKPQTGGNVIQFRPLQGFGKGPYKINVTVTNGVTDLSGNNIIRQFSYSFRTESNANAVDFGVVEEKFDTTTRRDGSFVPSGDYVAALWNDTSARGFLTTRVTETQFEALPPNPTGSVNSWFNTPIICQYLMPSAFLGSRARTLTGFSWRAGAAVAGTATYTSTQVRIGHAADSVALTGLSGGAPASSFGDVTVVTLPASYTPPATASGQNVRGPAWYRTWDYNGTGAIVLEVNHTGNTAGLQYRWSADTAFSQTAFSSNFATALLQSWFFRTTFHYLTPGAEAQSTFYDTTKANAQFLPQQLVPTSQPQGTAVTLLWQGAKESLSAPGTPDPNTYTSFLADVRQISNYRFLRFRATLLNNTTLRTSPSIDTITVPYTFRQ